MRPETILLFLERPETDMCSPKTIVSGNKNSLKISVWEATVRLLVCSNQPYDMTMVAHDQLIFSTWYKFKVLSMLNHT